MNNELAQILYEGSLNGNAVVTADKLNRVINSVANGSISTLQDVTDAGNSTTNDINFEGVAGLLFDNGSRVRKGTTDANLGGNKGVALRCSIDYELKWDAGSLYVMQQDGFTIREVAYKFNLTPQVTDDNTKGFVVGSKWVLDDGTTYVCSDASTGASVWSIYGASGTFESQDGYTITVTNGIITSISGS